jgi:zinc transport system permease protein
LIGDGLGHVALTGVAIGVLTGRAPVGTALVAAVVGAVVIELVRARGRTSGDVALAILFYGGIAGGVVLMSQASGGTPANLNAYLFGAITTTTRTDLVVFGVLCASVVAICLAFARELFTATSDEEYARAVGVPVLAANMLVAVLAATTVVLAMRVVGLLLVSALMVVPVATAQLLCRSFAGTRAVAVGIGLAVSVSGVALSYTADTPSGGTIVLLAIAAFTVTAAYAGLRDRVHRRRAAAEHHFHEHGADCGHEAVLHDDHVDYVHDGHRHAPHAGHYDEH